MKFFNDVSSTRQQMDLPCIPLLKEVLTMISSSSLVFVSSVVLEYLIHLLKLKIVSPNQQPKFCTFNKHQVTESVIAKDT